jgi:hypothetical protein
MPSNVNTTQKHSTLIPTQPSKTSITHVHFELFVTRLAVFFFIGNTKNRVTFKIFLFLEFKCLFQSIKNQQLLLVRQLRNDR